MSNESSESTPADAGLRRDAAPEAIACANLGLIFTELGRTLAALARRVDSVQGIERAALFAQIGRELREQADLSHETARLFEDATAGRVRPADTRTRRLIWWDRLKRIFNTKENP
jgi:hypothetical protein